MQSARFRHLMRPDKTLKLGHDIITFPELIQNTPYAPQSILIDHTRKEMADQDMGGPILEHRIAR